MFPIRKSNSHRTKFSLCPSLHKTSIYFRVLNRARTILGESLSVFDSTLQLSTPATENPFENGSLNKLCVKKQPDNGVTVLSRHWNEATFSDSHQVQFRVASGSLGCFAVLAAPQSNVVSAMSYTNECSVAVRAITNRCLFQGRHNKLITEKVVGCLGFYISNQLFQTVA